MEGKTEYYTTSHQGPVTYTTGEPTVTYTTSEPTVTYTTSEPTVTYTTSEPTVTYTTSEPTVTYTSSEPTVTYTSSEPTVTYTSSEPTVTYTSSEPVVTYTSSEPTVTYTSSEPVVTYTTTKSDPNVTYSTTTTTKNQEEPSVNYSTKENTHINTSTNVPNDNSTNVHTVTSTDINQEAPKETIVKTDHVEVPEYTSEKNCHFDGKEGLHNDSKVADSNEQGHVEEYNEKGNQINIIMSAGEKSLIRKLDFIYVMPYICILNFLQFFDKSALGYSAVLGIVEDTHLVGNQYSWLGSIFYLGYLLFQGPSMILIQKASLSKYMGAVITVWGVVLILTYKCTSFSQLAGLRFLLGFFEAGIYPCCIMLISSMYRRNEQAARIGLVYICNGLAMAVGGLISYGIGNMVNILNLAPWQWIMIILGSFTTLFGIISFFFLVDSPKAKVLRLTPEEEKAVDDRMRDNAVTHSKEIKKSQIYEALKEPRFYIFCLASLLINLQNSALNSFSSIITKGFGFTSLNAILLTIPSGITDCLYIAVVVWYNRRYGNTLYTGCVLLSIAIVGLILLVVIPIPKAKLLGLYMVWAFVSAFVMLLVSVANNVAGYTKKVFYSTAMMVFYTFGNFIGPFMMVSKQAPLYIGGMVGCIVGNFVTILLFLYAQRIMAKENRERIANPSNQVTHPDMTDVENKNFIYRL